MTTADRVRAIIVNQLGVDEEEATDAATLWDDLGTDSLDAVELVMAFDEEFGIDIPNADFENIRTVRDAIDYVERKVAALKKPTP